METGSIKCAQCGIMPAVAHADGRRLCGLCFIGCGSGYFSVNGSTLIRADGPASAQPGGDAAEQSGRWRYPGVAIPSRPEDWAVAVAQAAQGLRERITRALAAEVRDRPTAERLADAVMRELAKPTEGAG